MNKALIISDTNPAGRSYDVLTSSAMKVAREYGRAEGGEVVTVYGPTGRPLSCVRWSTENGGMYYRALG